MALHRCSSNCGMKTKNRDRIFLFEYSGANFSSQPSWDKASRPGIEARQTYVDLPGSLILRGNEKKCLPRFGEPGTARPTSHETLH